MQELANHISHVTFKGTLIGKIRCKVKLYSEIFNRIGSGLSKVFFTLDHFASVS